MCSVSLTLSYFNIFQIILLFLCCSLSPSFLITVLCRLCSFKTLHSPVMFLLYKCVYSEHVPFPLCHCSTEGQSVLEQSHILAFPLHYCVLLNLNRCHVQYFLWDVNTIFIFIHRARKVFRCNLLWIQCTFLPIELHIITNIGKNIFMFFFYLFTL